MKSTGLTNFSVPLLIRLSRYILVIFFYVFPISIINFEIFSKCARNLEKSSTGYLWLKKLRLTRYSAGLPRGSFDTLHTFFIEPPFSLPLEIEKTIFLPSGDTKNSDTLSKGRGLQTETTLSCPINLSNTFTQELTKYRAIRRSLSEA